MLGGPSEVEGVTLSDEAVNEEERLQERATLFVPAGTPVYEGQIVGENRRPGDLNVNICRAKKLTNIRAAGSDENVILKPARELFLEAALLTMDDHVRLTTLPVAEGTAAAAA